MSIWRKIRAAVGIKDYRTDDNDVEPAAPTLLSRTHFHKRRVGVEAPEWYWITETPEGTVTESAEQGFHSLDKALRRFLIQHGYSDWVHSEGMFSMPPGHVLQKVSRDHWVLQRH